LKTKLKFQKREQEGRRPCKTQASSFEILGQKRIKLGGKKGTELGATKGMAEEMGGLTAPATDNSGE